MLPARLVPAGHLPGRCDDRRRQRCQHPETRAATEVSVQEIPVFKESCSDDTRVADIAACRKAREQRAAAAPTSEGGGAREAGTVLLRGKGTATATPSSSPAPATGICAGRSSAMARATTPSTRGGSGAGAPDRPQRRPYQQGRRALPRARPFPPGDHHRPQLLMEPAGSDRMSQHPEDRPRDRAGPCICSAAVGSPAAPPRPPQAAPPGDPAHLRRGAARQYRRPRGPRVACRIGGPRPRAQAAGKARAVLSLVLASAVEGGKLSRNVVAGVRPPKVQRAECASWMPPRLRRWPRRSTRGTRP